MFIVELDKLINDTINVGGKELFIDTALRWVSLTIASTKAWWSHLLQSMTQEWTLGTPILPPSCGYSRRPKAFGEDYDDKNYICMYDPENIMANQAIAYKKKDTDDINVCGGWIIMEPYHPEKVQRSTVIEEVDLKEKKVSKGRLAFESEGSKELGIDLKEIVAFKEGIAYPFKIDGKDYIRVSKEMVDYVIVES